MWFVYLAVLLVTNVSSLELERSTACSDNKISCPIHMSSCCSSNDHQAIGCCPFPKATCCKDNLHCCPEETTCDVVRGECKRNDDSSSSHPWASIKHLSIGINQGNVSSKLIHQSLENSKIVCPGSTQSCADGYTCCPSPSGVYGCCPMQDAVCCADQIHCCPKGTSCDPKGKCSRNASMLKVSVESVTCQGGEFQCPDHSTCCEMAGGQYGCCPFENASCCSDLLSCCPRFYTCSASGGCVRS